VSDYCFTPSDQFIRYIHHGENKLPFDEIISAFYQIITLSLIFIVLDH